MYPNPRVNKRERDEALYGALGKGNAIDTSAIVTSDRPAPNTGEAWADNLITDLRKIGDEGVKASDERYRNKLINENNAIAAAPSVDERVMAAMRKPYSDADISAGASLIGQRQAHAQAGGVMPNMAPFDATDKNQRAAEVMAGVAEANKIRDARNAKNLSAYGTSSGLNLDAQITKNDQQVSPDQLTRAQGQKEAGSAIIAGNEANKANVNRMRHAEGVAKRLGIPVQTAYAMLQTGIVNSVQGPSASGGLPGTVAAAGVNPSMELLFPGLSQQQAANALKKQELTAREVEANAAREESARQFDANLRSTEGDRLERIRQFDAGLKLREKEIDDKLAQGRISAAQAAEDRALLRRKTEIEIANLQTQQTQQQTQQTQQQTQADAASKNDRIATAAPNERAQMLANDPVAMQQYLQRLPEGQREQERVRLLLRAGVDDPSIGQHALAWYDANKPNLVTGLDWNWLHDDQHLAWKAADKYLEAMGIPQGSPERAAIEPIVTRHFFRAWD